MKKSRNGSEKHLQADAVTQTMVNKSVNSDYIAGELKLPDIFQRIPTQLEVGTNTVANVLRENLRTLGKQRYMISRVVS